MNGAAGNEIIGIDLGTTNSCVAVMEGKVRCGDIMDFNRNSISSKCKKFCRSCCLLVSTHPLNQTAGTKSHRECRGSADHSISCCLH